MARFWARWYEPKASSTEKARECLTVALGEHGATVAIAALIGGEFEINWPFWDIPEHPHMIHHWISGEAASGAYCVVCAVFEAPDEETVRAEIGERESVDVDQKPDGWMPEGGRFPTAA